MWSVWRLINVLLLHKEVYVFQKASFSRSSSHIAFGHIFQAFFLLQNAVNAKVFGFLHALMCNFAWHFVSWFHCNFCEKRYPFLEEKKGTDYTVYEGGGEGGGIPPLEAWIDTPSSQVELHPTPQIWNYTPSRNPGNFPWPIFLPLSSLYWQWLAKKFSPATCIFS